MASKKGDREVVQTLLESGADVDAKADNGWTAAMEASVAGHRDVVEALLARGVHINAKGEKGVNALLLAAQEGRIEVVQLLLDNGADPSIKEADGTTPLMAAAYHGHHEIVRLLLGKGANVNARKNDGGHALDAANAGGHAEVRAVLIKAGAIEDSVDANMVRQLVMAVVKYSSEELKSLVARANPKEINAAVSIQNMQDASPLHLAVVAGRADAVELLLAAGAHIDSQDAKGSTPLHIAANMKDRTGVARVLVTSGADTEVREYRQGIKPLHFAAMMGHDEVVAVLLGGRADKNALDSEGCSPLHYAAMRGHASVAKRLLSAGADTTVRLRGETPLDVATKAGHTDVADLLRAALLKAPAGQ
jgi:ankyrin repeat protein